MTGALADFTAVAGAGTPEVAHRGLVEASPLYREPATTQMPV